MPRGGTGTVLRELARLEKSGLVNARRVGNHRHYQANAAAPLWSWYATPQNRRRALIFPGRASQFGPTSGCFDARSMPGAVLTERALVGVGCGAQHSRIEAHCSTCEVETRPKWRPPQDTWSVTPSAAAPMARFELPGVRTGTTS
jgi:hypothetical protein